MPKVAKEEKVSSSEFLKQTLTDTFKQADSNVYIQIVLFFAIAGLIAGAIYIYLRVGQELTVRQEVKPPEIVMIPENKNEETTTQFSQDQQRKNDVFILNSALKAYFLEKKVTPSDLKDLGDEFIDEVPKDPFNDEDYIYEPSEDKKTWKLSSVLSDGSKFEVKGP